VSILTQINTFDFILLFHIKPCKGNPPFLACRKFEEKQ
jgi:hypothetical protein